MTEVECIEAAVPSLIKDYLNQADALAGLYTFSPDLAGLKQASKGRSKKTVDRETLVNVLREQASTSSFTSKKSKENIERLVQDDCFTVTTGHQLCILGGPMFFFYKILSAIKLCEMAEDEGMSVVPVYWMASEDHDFEEVRSVNIEGKSFTWDEDLKGPVGHHLLEGLQPVLDDIEAHVGEVPGREDTVQLLRELYAPHKTLAQATRDLVNWAFGEHGIVVLDADDSSLKRLFTNHMQADVFDETAFQAVEHTSEALESMGYKSQVTPRQINLFYMETGYRERIVSNEDRYQTTDGKFTWTADSFKELLRSHPERLSPNVVLRPVYQEVVLPNLTYIGGPGELSYWLQFKSSFEEMQVFYPQLVLRDMAVYMDEKTSKRMRQLKLTASDVYRSFEDLLKEGLRELGTHEYLVEEKRSVIDEQMKELEGELKAFDASLAESTRAEHQRMMNRIDALMKKVLRSDRRSNETIERRLKEWKAVVHPDGVPQERVANWISFFTKENLSSSLETFSKQFNPLNGYIKVFTEK